MAAGIRKARRADAARLTEIAHAAKRHWGYTNGLIELWSAEPLGVRIRGDAEERAPQ